MKKNNIQATVQNIGSHYVPIKVLNAIRDYKNWLNELRVQEWRVYYFAALFEHLGVSETRVVPVMKNEIATLQARILTRYCRNPHSSKPKPIWIVVPDKPVYKKKKILRVHAFRDPNYGIHMNGIVAVPPSHLCRSSMGLKKLVEETGGEYFTKGTRIVDLHFKRIRDDLQKPVDYSFKHVKRGTFSIEDDLLILPRRSHDV
ncbi:MAG: hypothetical protein KF826_03935 [Xanthobacteraceae bacterium]|nr:hypothetical protein [Xanthobacteraceae bacterium]MBX3533479.1 hypothetical protein [Xanthobacteraceae bacterium]MCW5676419.1 hypothetical protein [Xanthobacteraceae bacterium]